jgi:hypothetical protein
MASAASDETSDGVIHVDLRNPRLAAFLAWLWPGAGHLYQRRYAKGILFMVCILGTYFFGLAMGGGHVVYASWKRDDFRWQYICQLGVGAPALPAVAQSHLVRRGNNPLWITGYRDPRTLELIDPARGLNGDELVEGFMAPPPDLPLQVMRQGRFDPEGRTALSLWHQEYAALFELGTLYTVIAGLLNVLAIYDAAAGPILPAAKSREGEKDGDEAKGEESKEEA